MMYRETGRAIRSIQGEGEKVKRALGGEALSEKVGVAKM